MSQLFVLKRKTYSEANWLNVVFYIYFVEPFEKTITFLGAFLNWQNPFEMVVKVFYLSSIFCSFWADTGCRPNNRQFVTWSHEHFKSFTQTDLAGTTLSLLREEQNKNKDLTGKWQIVLDADTQSYIIP